MKTDIPTELVEAQRAHAEAKAEHARLASEAEAAWHREREAEKRYHKAHREFMAQVDRQVQELAGFGEGT